MTILEIFKTTLKHKITLIATIIVCALVGGFVGLKYGQAHYENSIFVDLSVQDKFQHTSAYENLQAADQITESIQGWIKDPSFQEAVNKGTGSNFPIQGKKQEKNNLIISFNTPSSDQAPAYASQVAKQLQTRIQEYNTNSDLNIFANFQPLQTSFKGSQLITYTILATLAGLVLGVILITFFSNLGKK